MKSNEDYLKELYSAVLIKSIENNTIIKSIGNAEQAIKSFSEQFESKEILKPIDDVYIKIWNPEQEQDVLNGIVKMRRYRFKGCSLDYSLQKIPSIDLGGFPYWLQINNDGTLEIETKKPMDLR